MKLLKKRPIQIYIEPGQDSLLDILSQKRGVSKAAIIREGIEKILKELPVKEDPAMELIGLGGSGKRDISKNHDVYLVKHTAAKKK